MYSTFNDKLSRTKYTNKCLVLDIDETLVHTFDSFSLLKQLRIFSDPANTDLRIRTYTLRLENEQNDHFELFGVTRPYVEDFLSFCFKYFQSVIVWSAGQKTYVHDICKFLFRNLRQPDLIWTRNDCIITTDSNGEIINVEKPLANSIAECDLMVMAARKYNRVVQVGQQQRSGDHWKKAITFIREGKIGQLRKIKVWGNFNYGIGSPVIPDEPIPAGVDYDRWLGPAPQRTFNKSRFHGSWRMFWDYGGGLLTDWGVHLIDMALWSKNIDYTPLSVVATGGNFSFPGNAHETFDTMNVEYQLKDILISWEHTAGTQQGPYNRSYGLAFTGNDATLVADREGWELFPENDNGRFKVPALPKQDGRDSHEEHMKNFIECIKSRQDPNCPIENGRLVALYTHMGNIALRTQTRLEWNDTNKNFGDNKAANALIMPAYRKPWHLPKV